MFQAAMVLRWTPGPSLHIPFQPVSFPLSSRSSTTTTNPASITVPGPRPPQCYNASQLHFYGPLPLRANGAECVLVDGLDFVPHCCVGRKLLDIRLQPGEEIWLVSGDVVSMYPNIPIEDGVRHIATMLGTSSMEFTDLEEAVNLDITSKEELIIILLRLMLQYNYTTFESGQHNNRDTYIHRTRNSLSATIGRFMVVHGCNS
ncbi:uncharacterized protein ARMOST_07658 [Armillaria ostoyae]|uniref:Uncharacterized protein n=1 Tax=Armillaria ostoyae TaxID=47428 RepID=A0A284R6F2_ARMOS|nr:uncharacterized protein ARMOST_07658 [Armillaria ostoyae]